MQNSTENEIIYPMRLNRYLALNNYCSRREADVLIEAGAVKINGKTAKVGDKIQEKDKIEVNAKLKSRVKNYVYFAFNKPRGIVTHSPKDGQRSIEHITKLGADVFPVGRLDKDSRGLIILSNDGRITDKLLNPERDHEKEYVVTVDKPITNIFLKIMGQGVELEDFKTRPAKVEKIDQLTFRIVLTEGKKHQIRRMCAALGWQVQDLKRVRIMNIELGRLAKSQLRPIKDAELQTLLTSLGIK